MGIIEKKNENVTVSTLPSLSIIPFELEFLVVLYSTIEK